MGGQLGHVDVDHRLLQLDEPAAETGVGLGVSHQTRMLEFLHCQSQTSGEVRSLGVPTQSSQMHPSVQAAPCAAVGPDASDAFREWLQLLSNIVDFAIEKGVIFLVVPSSLTSCLQSSSSIYHATPSFPLAESQEQFLKLCRAKPT